MNTKQQIQNFLHNLTTLSSNGLNLNSEMVYDYLVGFDKGLYLNVLPSNTDKGYLNELNHFDLEKDKISEISNNLHSQFMRKKFKNMFSKNKVYVDNTLKKSYTYFIYGNVGVENSLKLYINLKVNKNTETSIFKIINFMEKEKICNQSKMSMINRLDFFVVRVNSENDLNKVAEFINENISQSDLNELNPFVKKEEKVGLAKDSHLSYNNEIAILIAQFINLRKIQKLDILPLNKIDLYFAKFVSEHKFNSKTDEINRLLFSCITNEKNFFEVLNSNNFLGLEEVNSAIDDYEKAKIDAKEIKEKCEMDSLIRAIELTNFKYYKKGYVVRPFFKLLFEHDIMGFSCYCGARDLVENIDIKNIVNILSEQDTGDTLENKVIKFEDGIISNFFADATKYNEQKIVLLKDAFSKVLEDKGYNYLVEAIMDFNNLGDVSKFDKEHQSMLKSHIEPQDLLSVLSDLNQEAINEFLNKHDEITRN